MVAQIERGVVGNVPTAATSARVAEVDFFRGVLILLVTLDHFFVVTASMFSLPGEFYAWYSKAVQSFYLNAEFRGGIAIPVVRIFFVTIAGISTVFSRNNFRRGLEVLAISMIVTFGTFVVKWLFLPDLVPILFNPLHAIAVSILLTGLLKKLKMPDKVLLVAAVPMLVSGFYFLFETQLQTESLLLGILFNASSSQRATDFYPLFPALGLFFVGYVIGNKLYQERKSLMPILGKTPFNFVRLCGRHTLLVYCLPPLGLIIVMGLLSLFV